MNNIGDITKYLSPLDNLISVWYTEFGTIKSILTPPCPEHLNLWAQDQHIVWELKIQCHQILNELCIAHLHCKENGGGHSRCHPRINMRHTTEFLFLGAKMIRFVTETNTYKYITQNKKVRFSFDKQKCQVYEICYLVHRHMDFLPTLFKQIIKRTFKCYNYKIENRNPDFIDQRCKNENSNNRNVMNVKEQLFKMKNQGNHSLGRMT
ncbi:hypothetical protein AGLY_006070 [Aphis glycines]|uniref:Uncharacterized protein n=1 Tax=Aphis glycines TaxID=307491 RepID=A0A6G0TSP1_APHGL|nr:hypothetical protein AGLY_006070 [Aphis glycines]